MVKGAVLLTLTVLLAALALDLAVYFARMGRAQWEAEGMATAAARQLSINGSEADSLSAANLWLANNERDLSTAECCTFADWRPHQRPDGILDTVTATARVAHTTFILSHFGLPGELFVERSATAQVVGAKGAPICPWGIVAASSEPGVADYGFVPGRVYSFNLADRSQDGGSFVPLDLAGGGVADYEKTIAAGCRKEDTGIWSVGDVVRLLPSGNEAAQATLRALIVHFGFESGDGTADYLGPTWCDVTSEPDGGADAGRITGFNPYTQPPRSECVRGSGTGGVGRLIVVPIVSSPQGGESVRILGLTSLYLASWDRGPSAAQRLYGIFFDRARLNVNDVNLVGVDDAPLAPLRIALTH